MSYTRREVLRNLTLAGAASLLGVRPETLGAEPPETTTFRIAAVSVSHLST